MANLAAAGTRITAPAALPYGPLLSRLLRPMQRGFLVLNGGLMAPLLRHGFGWLLANPFTGHLMLLRTRGRRTEQTREAPLGYVIADGVVYCVAGYGEPTPWFRNLVAEPAVEVILPTRRFRGRAEPVTDDAEWLRAYRSLIASFGLVGRAVVGDVRTLGDADLLARHRTLPVVRIRPEAGETPVVAGPFDPGHAGWLLPYVVTVLGGGLWMAWRRRRGQRGQRRQA
jgi:deazaflavin-dependent oxidoreductase (nitroreductase family)